MGTTNNTDTERAFAGAGTTACPCGAETNGAEGSRTRGRDDAGDRGYTALQVLDLLNAQQVALLAGAEKRAARLRDAVFAAGRAAGAPEGLEPVALAEWIERIASLREVRVASMTPAGGCVMASTEPAECSSDAADAQAFRALCDAVHADPEVWSVQIHRLRGGRFRVEIHGGGAAYPVNLHPATSINAACARAAEWAHCMRERVSAAKPAPSAHRREVGGPEDAFHAVFTREPGASRWVYGCEHIADELRDNFHFKAQNGVEIKSWSFPTVADGEVFLRGADRKRDAATRIFASDPDRYIDALRDALIVARKKVERRRSKVKGGVA